ncbi:MAG: tyrosine-type recombinase/integrase, partial [Azoarcus sp.]|nr:tyrosine-type recombinase/integrase [Azoarcus sp.]
NALHNTEKGITLFRTRLGRPIRYGTARELWSRATRSAGIGDAHIHDIRAKAATDARAQGLDSKKLLGHASDSAHMRYLRSKEIPVAEPVSLKRT